MLVIFLPQSRRQPMGTTITPSKKKVFFSFLWCKFCRKKFWDLYLNIKHLLNLIRHLAGFWYHVWPVFDSTFGWILAPRLAGFNPRQWAASCGNSMRNTLRFFLWFSCITSVCYGSEGSAYFLIFGAFSDKIQVKITAFSEEFASFSTAFSLSGTPTESPLHHLRACRRTRRP